LDEGMTKEAMWRDAERMTREQFCDKWGQEHAEFWDNIMGEMDEGSMADAEHHSTGPKFTGYWKGTDAGTPGTKMVGGAAESVEQECEEPMSLTDRLKARWAETKRAKGLDEAGANNPAPNTAGTTATAPDPAAQAKELAGVQQSINKFKSAGVPIANVQQAAKTVMKDPTDPKTPQNAQDKQVKQNLGMTMANLIDKGNPSQINQMAQTIKQIQKGMK
jgi:hypothetical protein